MIQYFKDLNSFIEKAQMLQGLIQHYVNEPTKESRAEIEAHFDELTAGAKAVFDPKIKDLAGSALDGISEMRKMQAQLKALGLSE